MVTRTKSISMDVDTSEDTITRVWFSPYYLFPINTLNAKSSAQHVEGFLLRVEYTNGALGHASLQSWETLGDPSLKQLFEELKSGEWNRSSLLSQTLKSSKIDAQARSKNINLLKGIKVPESHATIPALEDNLVEYAVAKGFDTLKLKVGRNLKYESEWINSLTASHEKLRLRLDFNFSQNRDAILSWWKLLSENTKNTVEFVEDPFKGFLNEEILPFSSGIDRNLPELSNQHTITETSTLVWKPALTSTSTIAHLVKNYQTKWISTSYMDHPIGQSFAAYQSISLNAVDSAKKTKLRCGLVTQNCFAPNAYSECFDQAWNPKFPKVTGNGWGFDQLLDQEPWKLCYQKL